MARREDLERPSSRPITIAPVTTRRDWNFNRSAWSRISQSPSKPHIICRPTAFLPRDHQENSCTGHKPSSGKVRENLTKVLGISTNSRGEVTTSLQKCGRYLSNNIANDEKSMLPISAFLCQPLYDQPFYTMQYFSLFLKRIVRDTTQMVEQG